MQNTVTNHARLKKAIPYGGVKEIARRSNTSIFTVSRVIKGISNNLKVKEVITDYLIEINITSENLNKIVATLTN